MDAVESGPATRYSLKPAQGVRRISRIVGQ